MEEIIEMLQRELTAIRVRTFVIEHIILNGPDADDAVLQAEKMDADNYDPEYLTAYQAGVSDGSWGRGRKQIENPSYVRGYSAGYMEGASWAEHIDYSSDYHDNQ